jgi:hypothetical protein
MKKTILGGVLILCAVHGLPERTAHVFFESFPASLKSQIIIAKNERLRETDAKGIPSIKNLQEVIDHGLIRPTVTKAELHSNFWLRVGSDGEVNKTSAAFIPVNVLRQVAAVHLVVLGITNPGGFLERWPFRMQ